MTRRSWVAAVGGLALLLAGPLVPTVTGETSRRLPSSRPAHLVDATGKTVGRVMNALSPAKVQRVTIIDDKEKVMEVVVEDSQLSLAIGKKGQNVRLAAKLTGWRIDIKSEEEKRKEVEAQFGALEAEAASVDGDAPVGEAEAQAEPAAAADGEESKS